MSSAIADTRCSVCSALNSRTGTEWVYDASGWWYAVCSSCWSRLESTISEKQRRHLDAHQVRSKVAERAIVLAEVEQERIKTAADLPRHQRRRLN